MVTSILKRMWWIRIITEMISSKIFVYVGFTDLKLPAFNALCHRYIPWDRLFHSQYTKWRKNLELKKNFLCVKVFWTTMTPIPPCLPFSTYIIAYERVNDFPPVFKTPRRVGSYYDVIDGKHGGPRYST